MCTFFIFLQFASLKMIFNSCKGIWPHILYSNEITLSSEANKKTNCILKICNKNDILFILRVSFVLQSSKLCDPTKQTLLNVVVGF